MLIKLLIEPLLRRRLARGKEHPERWRERLGEPGLARPPGRLIWLHGASVGESLSALPLIAALRAAHPDVTVLVTTGTVTSARLMAERLPAGACHQFVPVDHPAAVRRFLDHWRPDLALWLESELWPNLLRLTARRGVPLVLINARMSQRSFTRWRRLRPIARWLLGTFRLVLAQSSADAQRFAALGAREVAEPGNLKYAAEPLPADAATLAELRQQIGQPVWVAASTHPGEERLAGEVHRALLASFPELTTVIAPRHPPRGAEIAAELNAQGLRLRQRSQGEAPEPGAIYLADTLGEMGLWYRLAPLVLIGGALVGKGGQNPLEPARLGAALLFGPDMGNFAEIAARLLEAGAARRVGTDDLAAVIAESLSQPEALAEAGAAGRAVAASEGAVVARVLDRLRPFLPGAES